MRIIQRNVLESIGAAVTSGIRLWKATAPTALHSDYAPERPERRSRMWAAGSRGSGSSELGIPQPVSTVESSSSESSHSNNVRSASTMIPCFPANNSTMRITVILYRIVPRHLILQRILLLILPKSEPGQLQTNETTAWKIKKDII